MTGDELFLRHMLDALARVETYTAVGQAEFMVTPHWQDAVMRQLEIVGEATKRLSDTLRTAHPDIPWRRIAGWRDVLIHDYMTVDIEAVWAVTQGDAPMLRQGLMAILESGELIRDSQAT